MFNLDFLSNDYEESKTPVEKATDAIAIEILSGSRPAGRRIVEQQICDQYGISRTPARVVLSNLANLGLIELIPNRGAVVTGYTSRDIDDFLYLKTLLYPQCVQWAVERITEDELAMLEEIFSFMEFYTATGDLEKMLRINRGFHTLIYHACHNRDLENDLLQYDFFIRHAHAEVRFPANFLETVLEEHRAIYQAFRDRNPEAGADAAQVHAFRSMLRRR